VAAAVPVFVLTGAGVLIFGMVAASGIRTLGNVDFQSHRHNLFIVAIGIGCCMIRLIARNCCHAFPAALQPHLHSGILLATVVAVGPERFLQRRGRDRACGGERGACLRTLSGWAGAVTEVTAPASPARFLWTRGRNGLVRRGGLHGDDSCAPPAVRRSSGRFG
jgi:hypothetical protein